MPVVENLTMADVAVHIAQDALHMLDNGAIVPTRSIWIKVLDYNPETQGDVEFKDLQNRCKVCALGSLLLAHLRRGHFRPNGFGLCVSNPHIWGNNVRYLEAYFRERELGMMEAVFEEGYGAQPYALTDEDWEAARRYGLTFDSHEQALRAILTNVIDNQGTFVVPREHYLPPENQEEA